MCCVVLDVGANFIADAGAGLNNSPNDLHCDAEGGGGGGPGADGMACNSQLHSMIALLHPAAEWRCKSYQKNVNKKGICN